MKTLATTLALLALSSAAAGVPVLTWEQVYYRNHWGQLIEGDGWIVSVCDDQSASWAVNIDFCGCGDGPIVQVRAFGSLDVNWESEARAFLGGDWPYGDSWVFDEWNELATGISGPPDAPFHIHAGTPGGMAFGTLNLVYLVVEEGGWICWDGAIARQGVDYPTSGSIPEPIAAVVLLSGCAILTRRRRNARLRRSV